jgi:hypothetical protein
MVSMDAAGLQDIPGQMWPKVPTSTAEELFAALDEESAEEDQDHLFLLAAKEKLESPVSTYPSEFCRSCVEKFST